MIKQNYSIKSIGVTTLITLLISFTSYTQDIHFTFANAQNTNDVTNDYYEVDVMVQTVNSTGSFKLGSGQLYFTYSTAAFGNNVYANGSIEISQTNPDYICGQYIDAAAANIYGTFTVNDNTTSRVSWAFSQAFSSSTFVADNINETPTKLCHIKIKYANVAEDPMFLFEEGSTYDDQFYTACGSTGGGAFDTADCGNFPGTQLTNDSFDSSEATLNTNTPEFLANLSISPNPTKDILYIKGDVSKLKTIEIFTLTGQKIRTINKDFNTINTFMLESSIYFVKFSTKNQIKTFKIVKE